MSDGADDLHMDVRLGFGPDGLLRMLEGVEVAVALDNDLRALLAHEVDRRLADPMGQEHRALEVQDIGYTGCGGACVSAGCND